MPPHHQQQSATKGAVENSGLDVKTLSDATSVVVKTAGQAVDVASPVLSQVAGALSNSDPTTLVEVALGGAVLLWLTPSILGLLKGSFRSVCILFRAQVPVWHACSTCDVHRCWS